MAMQNITDLPLVNDATEDDKVYIEHNSEPKRISMEDLVGVLEMMFTDEHRSVYYWSYNEALANNFTVPDTFPGKVGDFLIMRTSTSENEVGGAIWECYKLNPSAQKFYWRDTASPSNLSAFTNDVGFITAAAFVEALSLKAPLSDFNTLSARAVQPSNVTITQENWQGYNNANNLTPNRTYGISSRIIGPVPPEGETPDPTYGYVDNLPVYNKTAALTFIGASKTSKTGYQIYYNENECWFRKTDADGVGTWIQLIDESALNTALALKANTQDVRDALAQKVGIADMVPYLHYEAVSAPEEGTTYSLGDLTPNSYSYVNPSWCMDAPPNVAKAAWILTIIPKVSSSFGMQIWLEASSDIIYKRIKVKQHTDDGDEFVWSEWASVADPSLSVSGAFADAKAVGDALAQKLSPDDSRLLPYLHYVRVNQSSASSTYNSLLTNLTPNSYSWVSSTWFSDAPSNESAWIFSIVPTSISSFGMQIWFEPSTNILYKRRKATSGWSDWIRLDDAYKQNSIYFAFGDSTTKGQIGKWTGGTSYSTRGYPDTTATMLHMTLNNQAVGGQGLIKDWALIVDAINALDMSNAGLITVGWSYNSTATYRTQGLAMGSYTDVTSVDVTDADAVKALVTYDSEGELVEDGFGTTVIGYYYTIMKLLQTKCPSAQIVLVTGYGNGNGDRNTQKKADLTNQFTRVFTFGTGSSHTVKELYDELEKMANLHGWCCVNQSKGCAFNEFNAAFAFGDHIHPNDDGYAMYGNNLAPRIASFYANRKLITYDL